MITDQDFEHFLLMSAHVWPSVEALRPEFPRWRRRLHKLGVDDLPRTPAGIVTLRSQDPNGANAINQLTLLAKQASNARDARGEHNLRNLTKVRCWKS